MNQSDYNKAKQRVFEIISPSDDGDRVSFVFDCLIFSLIILSILSIILQSFDSLAKRFDTVFFIIEAVSVAVFTVEYIARLWTAPLAFAESKRPRIRYIFSGMAIIDLVAILPFYLPFIGVDLRFLRMFRMFRLLRVLKLGRYLQSLKTIASVIKETSSQLITALVCCMALLLFSAILLYSTENQVQPEAFPNVIESLWWAVCTLTTVGYGDVFPITALGKLCASIISVVGIGVIAIPTGIISAGFIRVVEKSNAIEESYAGEYCRHCGNKLS